MSRMSLKSVSLVYAVTVDPIRIETEFHLNPVGHSYPSGAGGELYTVTSAKEIASKIIVRFR